jgi:hypothetical protein
MKDEAPMGHALVGAFVSQPSQHGRIRHLWDAGHRRARRPRCVRNRPCSKASSSRVAVQAWIRLSDMGRLGPKLRLAYSGLWAPSAFLIRPRERSMFKSSSWAEEESRSLATTILVGDGPRSTPRAGDRTEKPRPRPAHDQGALGCPPLASPPGSIP